jgi:hypothetical protein
LPIPSTALPISDQSLKLRRNRHRPFPCLFRYSFKSLIIVVIVTAEESRRRDIWAFGFGWRFYDCWGFWRLWRLGGFDWSIDKLNVFARIAPIRWTTAFSL